MTLTELSIKHGIEPEKSREFLREWLDAQPIAAYQDIYGALMHTNVDLLPSDTPLIARPNMEDL